MSTIKSLWFSFSTTIWPFITHITLNAAEVCIVRGYLCHDIKQAMSYHIMGFYVMTSYVTTIVASLVFSYPGQYILMIQKLCTVLCNINLQNCNDKILGYRIRPSLVLVAFHEYLHCMSYDHTALHTYTYSNMYRDVPRFRTVVIITWGV